MKEVKMAFEEKIRKLQEELDTPNPIAFSPHVLGRKSAIHEALPIIHELQAEEKRLRNKFATYGVETPEKAELIVMNKQQSDALRRISAEGTGLRAIEEECRHDVNRFNYFAMRYWRERVVLLQEIARAVLGDTK